MSVAVSKRSLPRTLIFSSEAPHTAGAGAIILHRLLRDFPAPRLLVVTNRLPPPGAATLDCRYEHLPLAVDRLSRTRLAGWRPLLRTFGAARFVDHARIDAALAGFAPEVVVTVMQDSWFYELAADFAFRRNLPLVLLGHDLAHGFEPVPARWRPRQLARDKRVVRQAAARLCVSQPMADFFAAEFGVPAQVLLPPRSDTPVAQPPENCATLKDPDRLILGYAGGLHYGYGEQLLQLLPVLRATGTRVELFGPAPAGSVRALADATDVIRFHGYLSPPEEAWRQILARCDAVLQPYLNPPGPHELQYRTHFPSKLGDALSLGLPLLLTGPDFASGVRWCVEHGDIAEVVTRAEPRAGNDALARLRLSPERRIRLATAAQAAATGFDAPALRARWHATLVDVAAAAQSRA